MKKASFLFVWLAGFVLCASFAALAVDQGRIKEKHFRLQKEIIQIYLGFSFTVPDAPGIKIYQLVFKSVLDPSSPESHWKLLKSGTVTSSDGHYRIKSDGTTSIFSLKGPSNPNHDYPGSGTSAGLRAEEVNLFMGGQWKAESNEAVFPSEYQYVVCYVFPDNVITLGEWRESLEFSYNQFIYEEIQFLIPNSRGFFKTNFVTGSDELVLSDLQFVIARTKKK
jgi:hypothetical protein